MLGDETRDEAMVGGLYDAGIIMAIDVPVGAVGEIFML